MFKEFLNKLTRKKYFDEDDVESTDLTRCLSTFNLVAVGVGSTLGAGVYVLTGSVAREDAGPSIVLSFTVAAIASMLAGLCYAEFGARVPKAGSAYIYSYVTMGEFCGFVIGWNLVLEYIIGVSSVARAWSANLDSLTGGVIAHAFRNAMPMNISGLATYPDFLAVGLILLVTIMLSVGMKVSSLLMTILTAINIVVLIFCSIAGFIKADSHNWNIPASEVPDGFGNGGFLPYGFSKMMEGAATCFFAFVGFDTIACVGEEAKNPGKSIPRSIVITLIICLAAYVSVSSAVTLMKPYYALDKNAPLPDAFKAVGLSWAAKPVAVGSMCALIASVLGAAVGMPRIIFSMARDGLIFRFLSQVSQKSKTPVAATILSGIFSSVMALLFDLDDLVNMMSIGTLMAYTLVACSVLVLRYKPDDCDNDAAQDTERSLLLGRNPPPNARFPELSEFCLPKEKHVTPHTSNMVTWATALIVALMILLGVLLVWGNAYLSQWSGILLICILLLLQITLATVISRQPMSIKHLLFKTPLVPSIPLLSMCFNIYLMLKLPSMTWVRFGVWMIIGLLVYFGYGIRQSTEGKRSVEGKSSDIINEHD
ncbi:unnamed protein product [Clavelina lepadiformis]|uniref:Cationic amino acid transporter C-terminal domain-containing protein n=1 Tax=Clavelina lepadiformis TaxID=159417 RepID=A0ABP0GZC7_CLALP